jgi:hypothetical protein
MTEKGFMWSKGGVDDLQKLRSNFDHLFFIFQMKPKLP